MKKFLSFLSAVLLFATFSTSNAQLAKKSWAFGFGFSYPHLVSTNIVADNSTYGGYLSIQRNFSEHVGLRFRGSYNHLAGKRTIPGASIENNLISGDIDLVYYLAPCEVVSPYFNFGVGGVYGSLSGPYTTTSDNFTDYQVNLGIGAEWTVAPKWKIVSELGMHSVANSWVDGVYGTTGGGIFGGNTDMYMTFDIGANYYFKQGEPSKLCQLYNGLETPDNVDYERIENIVKKYIPREVIKQVVVEKPVAAAMNNNWVLVGANFAFNSASLKNEAFPVLWHANQVLLSHPDVRVEIQGYTDNIGSEKNNMRLSVKRAQAVKDYLMARGVSADRMVVKGYGESNPMASNKTAKGRAMNRRIEFKVLN